MRVVVPTAAGGRPRLVEGLLRLQGIKPEVREMTHDESYYELLLGLWRGGEGFIVVEHDVLILPWGRTIQEMWDCESPWCTRRYDTAAGTIEDGLGCAKFSGDLLRRFPRFLEEPFPARCSHTRSWKGLDRLVSERMLELGISPCVHEPGVWNL